MEDLSVNVTNGIRESAGAAIRGSNFQSATARTSRSLRTSIRADIGEAEAYKAALRRGEIGLQRPSGANLKGADFITAYYINNQMKIIVTDVKTTEVGKFPQPDKNLKKSWFDEVQKAILPSSLKLNDSILEKEIRDAFQKGHIIKRQLNVDYSPAGQGKITGW
jgi:hypothetical protein